MKPFKQIQLEQAQALTKLIKYAGSQSRLARAMNVSPQVVCNWAQRGRISATCAIEADALTNGYITKEDLRPDVDSWIEE